MVAFSSPSLSRRFRIDSGQITLTGRRDCTPDMLNETWKHLVYALKLAYAGQFQCVHPDYVNTRTEYNLSSHDSPRCNAFGDFPVLWNGQIVMFSLNTFDETCTAQDLLNVLVVMMSAVEIPIFPTQDEAVDKPEQSNEHAGELITFGSKQYKLAPFVSKKSDLPTYKKGELVCFRVIKIVHTIYATKAGAQKVVFDCYTYGQESNAKYPMCRIFADNEKMLDPAKPLAKELPDLPIPGEVSGEWYLTSNAAEAYEGQAQFWFTHLIPRTFQERHDSRG